jgi:hypothetical protein
MPNKFSEKRENVRTCLSARVTVKPVSKEYAENFSGFFTGMDSLMASSSSMEKNTPDAPDSIMEMLLGLDEKMDLVLSLLSGNSSLAQKRCEALDISGTGLCVLLDAKPMFGDHFEVTIRFSGQPLKILRVCAEVVRVSDYRGGRFEVGLKFMGLTDTEKEKIIALTFSENRKKIRNNKTLYSSY